MSTKIQTAAAILLSALILFSFSFTVRAEEISRSGKYMSTSLETTGAPVSRLSAATPPVATSAAADEEERPTGDFTVAAISQYIWRGYEMSRHSIVVQPATTIGYKGFSAGLWGNLDMRPYFAGATDTNYASSWNETDFTISYSKKLGIFNLGAGYIYYSLGALNKDAPDRADAQEIFASVSLNTLLAPTITAYKEIDHYRNWYFLLGISHTHDFTKRVSLKIAATASYLLSTYADASLFNAGAGYGGYPRFNSDAAATDDKFNNFHDGTVTLSLPVKAAGQLMVTPSIAYVFPLSDDARYEMKGTGLKGTASAGDRDSSYLYGGLSVSFSF